MEIEHQAEATMSSGMVEEPQQGAKWVRPTRLDGLLRTNWRLRAGNQEDLRGAILLSSRTLLA